MKLARLPRNAMPRIVDYEHCRVTVEFVNKFEEEFQDLEGRLLVPQLRELLFSDCIMKEPSEYIFELVHFSLSMKVIELFGPGDHKYRYVSMRLPCDHKVL